MEEQDKTIKCADQKCDRDFVFTINDQNFYKEHNYKEPKYCKFHREQRKAERANRENSPFKPALDEIRKHAYRHGNEPDDFTGAGYIGEDR